MNFFKKIQTHLNGQGILLDGQTRCQVKGCQFVSEWEQEITHQTEGKMVLDLCEVHMSDFEHDESLTIEVVKN